MNCTNCDTELRPSDRYCPACGQSVMDGRDRSFAHLLRLAFVELTAVDSRLWRSLRALIFQPGFLSKEYREGRRQRFLTPIGLFLLGNLLYFLAPPATDLQLSLIDQYELQPYSAWVKRWVDSYAAANGLGFEDVALLYQLKVAELAKVMVILTVPLVACVSMVLFVDRKLYYADHIVIGLHYVAFLLIYLISTSAVLGALFWLAPSALQSNVRYLVPAILLAQFLYVPGMLKRSMDVTWQRALLTTPVFIIGFLFTQVVYRLVQFLVAFSLVTTG